MASLTRNTFTAGTAIVAADMNSNFTNVEALINDVLDGTESHTNFTSTGTASLATVTVSNTVTATNGFVGNVTGNVTGSSGSCTGNAATATSAAACTGNAATATLAADATKLATPQAINGVNFDGSAPITVTAAASTLSGTELKAEVVTSSLTSVGTLGSLAVTNAVSANNVSLAAGASVGGSLTTSNGSASTPSHSFINDTNTGMYLSAADNIGFASGGTETFNVLTQGVIVPGTGNYFATSPNTGTGNDAEWTATGFGTFILNRNSSLTAEKENITDDLSTHLTADMIDSVVPKMWNRIHSPGYPEIGPLAEDMDAISPFLAARGADIRDGSYQEFLTGINKTAYLSLLVLAVKDLRQRMEAVEAE